MVFSDFGWVKGEDPVRVAGEMERRGVPIYTIPIGLPAPPDAMIAEVIAPEAVFRGDPVTLRGAGRITRPGGARLQPAPQGQRR